MPMQKRALDSTSSGEPSQPKRPCFDPNNQRSNVSESNLVLSSCFTVEDAQREVQKQAERVISLLAENFQSCIGDALKDIAQQVRSIENAVQKLTEVVVELANIHSPHLARPNAKSTENNGARNLQLRLLTKLSHPLFTGKKIEGEEGACIYIALIDVDTGDVVTSGLEASIKLDIVVLEGDFNKDDEDNWTQEEFENYVVKEREGKGPLLTGNLHVTLKEGVGELGDLTFTDNSSWNRSKNFRIGLKVASSYGGNTRIREAITHAFFVKEHRGHACQKHYPPVSDDEVWRLKSIAKDGPFRKRLNEAGIHKVEEFLRQLSKDSEKLRNILGKCMAEKKWEALLDHAKTCTPNGKLYVYHHDSESDHGVVFNNLGQLSGVTANGVYRVADRFSLQQKDYADGLVKKTCENWNDVRQFDAEASSSSMSEKISFLFSSEVLGDQHPVHNNMPSLSLACHVGLKVPPRNSASTVEGNSGITAAGLPIQLQSLNSQNATGNQIIDRSNQKEPSADTNVQPFGQPYGPPSSFPASRHTLEISVDESVCLAACRPTTPDHCNVLVSPGDNGIATVGWPMQSHDINIQCATHSSMIDSSSQTDYTVNQNVLPSEPPYASTSSFQSTSTTPFPGVAPMTENYLDYLLAEDGRTPTW